MSLELVVPACEIRDCGARADYLWAWGVAPATGSWLPLCAADARDLAEQLDPRPFRVTPIAEMPGEPFLASAEQR